LSDFALATPSPLEGTAPSGGRVLRRTLIGFCSERERPRSRATGQRSWSVLGLSSRQWCYRARHAAESNGGRLPAQK